ncbi:MAG: formylglycine-generating enzyme family protein [Planctomycetota bacterium]|jgi:formylglycine-generating enzyme required for sulfatase activity
MFFEEVGIINIRAILALAVVLFIVSGSSVIADCPSADLTGDCFVDFQDFAVIGAQFLNGYDWNDVNTLANQWLTTDPCVSDDMVYIPDGTFVMGDHFSPEGWEDSLPLHDVLVDAFFMSKYEITNSQCCDYLNAANSLGLIEVRSGIVYASPGGTDPYCDTHSYDTDSQIDYNDVTGTFSVREKDSRDMSDDPMVNVSWYGAVAYCNWRSSEEGYEACYNLSTWDCNFSKHGYRLPTEAEWEYAARGGLSDKRFPWADPNIIHSQANYYAKPDGYPYDASPTSDYHPLWEGGNWPYTSPVGFFDGTMKYKVDYNWPGSDTSYQTTSGANGYGLYDMAGNVWEWCNDWHDSDYYDTSPYDNPQGPASSPWDCRVLRGGSWLSDAFFCLVALRGEYDPDFRFFHIGFRLVLDFQ